MLRKLLATMATALVIASAVGAWAAPSDERNTPRGAMRGYLEATRAGELERAADFLDLRRMPPGRRREEGPRLARHLKIALDQTLWVDLDALSDQPDGHTDDGLARGRDAVGAIATSEGPVPVLLQRVPREGDGGPIWKISSATVAEIPALYDEFGYGPLGDRLPPMFFQSYLLEVMLWQWLALVLIVVVAWLLGWSLAAASVRLARPIVQRSDSQIDDDLLQAMIGPARLVLFVLFFRLCTRPLRLSLPVQKFFGSVGKAAAAIALTWLVIRLVDLMAQVVSQRLERRGAPTQQIVPLGTKVLKGLLVAVAALATLDSFGINVTALIAGLGVGGLAVALAAQKSLENLFGGFMLLADRPVKVGDFCRFGDQIGVIEEIGLRSTRIRTLDRTVISVPNAEFSNLHLENLAVRDRMRLHTTLGIRYETTPSQLRRTLDELRQVLIDHPRVSEDPRRVRFVGFGDSSLNIEVYAYIETREWNEYLALREEIYLRMMDAVERAGTGFAFPSQTVYLAQDEGIRGEAEA